MRRWRHGIAAAPLPAAQAERGGTSHEEAYAGIFEKYEITWL